MLAAIAWREWRHDWRMSLCLVSITAAISVPLLLLLTLRSGMLEEVREELTGSLVARELQVRRETPFSPQEVDAITRFPGVEHVEPQLRYLALGALVAKGEERESADMIAISPGNPLPAAAGSTVNLTSAIPTTALASRLGLVAGDRIDLVIDVRAEDGSLREEEVALLVAAILPRELEPRSALLVDALLVRAADRFRLSGGELSAGEALREFGGTPEAAPAASLRVFVRSIDWVERVRRELSNRGGVATGRLAEIRLLGRLDSGLTMLVGLLGSVMLLGLGLAVVATQAAWMDRKRLELSYLKLIGFGTSKLVAIIVFQAIMTAFCGIALALAIAVAVSGLVMEVIPLAGGFDPDLFALRPADIAVVALAIAGVSILAASTLTFSARRLQPADALRELA